MTKEELAAKLNGRECDTKVSKEEYQEAIFDKLVIVYGASDDLMEFEGAIYDELGAYNGTTAMVDTQGLQTTFEQLQSDNAGESEYEDYFNRKGCGREIKAVWDHDGYSWVIETEIPHATFEIMEDGVKYCKGIVFSMNDI